MISDMFFLSKFSRTGVVTPPANDTKSLVTIHCCWRDSQVDNGKTCWRKRQPEPLLQPEKKCWCKYTKTWHEDYNLSCSTALKTFPWCNEPFFIPIWSSGLKALYPDILNPQQKIVNQLNFQRWSMFISCVLVNCNTISVDKLNRNVCFWDGKIWEAVVVVEIFQLHPHCLVFPHIVIILLILALSSGSCQKG